MRAPTRTHAHTHTRARRAFRPYRYTLFGIIYFHHQCLLIDFALRAARSTWLRAATDAQCACMPLRPLTVFFFLLSFFSPCSSSSAGKFTELQFDENCLLVGSKCVTYLLEKSRVVAQSDLERNYHVLYQVSKTDSPCNNFCNVVRIILPLTVLSPASLSDFRPNGYIISHHWCNNMSYSDFSNAIDISSVARIAA
jgi:hypothetical protein